MSMADSGSRPEQDQEPGLFRTLAQDFHRVLADMRRVGLKRSMSRTLLFALAVEGLLNFLQNGCFGVRDPSDAKKSAGLLGDLAGSPRDVVLELLEFRWFECFLQFRDFCCSQPDSRW
jgi:hypothetical protein